MVYPFQGVHVRPADLYFPIDRLTFVPVGIRKRQPMEFARQMWLSNKRNSLAWTSLGSFWKNLLRSNMLTLVATAKSTECIFGYKPSRLWKQNMPTRENASNFTHEKPIKNVGIKKRSFDDLVLLTCFALWMKSLHFKISIFHIVFFVFIYAPLFRLIVTGFMIVDIVIMFNHSDNKLRFCVRC